MPGLRGTPAVTITTSAPSSEAYRLVPIIVASKPSIADACEMSSVFPCGSPSTMSNITTSPSSLSPAIWARVPPIIPPPTSAILCRAMPLPLKSDVPGAPVRRGVSRLPRTDKLPDHSTKVRRHARVPGIGPTASPRAVTPYARIRRRQDPRRKARRASPLQTR